MATPCSPLCSASSVSQTPLTRNEISLDHKLRIGHRPGIDRLRLHDPDWRPLQRAGSADLILGCWKYGCIEKSEAHELSMGGGEILIVSGIFCS